MRSILTQYEELLLQQLRTLGITTNDILKAVDWSSESLFQKFYYISTDNPSFGRAVLSTRGSVQ